jgi:hypothetical protein
MNTEGLTAAYCSSTSGVLNICEISSFVHVILGPEAARALCNGEVVEAFAAKGISWTVLRSRLETALSRMPAWNEDRKQLIV